MAIAIQELNTASSTSYLIYSTEHFYLRKNSILYEEVYIASPELKDTFEETDIPIPAKRADSLYVYNKYFGDSRTILQEDIDAALPYILKAFNQLPAEELYYVWFFFKDWGYSVEYKVNDIVLYENNLYKVLEDHISNQEPLNNKFYQKIERTFEKVQEWDNAIYMLGQRAKIGLHIYESLIDNNTWSPIDFPAAWKLIS